MPVNSKLENAIEIGDQEVCLQDLSSTTDQRTFGEIEEDEKAQWENVHRELKDCRFNSKAEAKLFIGRCIMHTLNALGANIERINLFGKMTKDEFEKKLYALYRIRVSKHRKSQHNEYWEGGTYIYKGDELAAFVSTAAFVKSEFVLSVPFWLVRTNVKLPGGKGVVH